MQVPMAKKTRKKKTESPTAAPSRSFAERMARTLYQPRTLVLAAMLVSSTVVVPLIGDWLPDLSARDEYRLRTADIAITQPPFWVPHDLVQQVIERAQLGEEVSLLDESLAAEIAEAFRLHPWVAEVVRVEKSLPARIEVELKYRRPVAMVQVKQGLYPVDPEGTLLPPADFSVAEARRYPRIENVLSTPQGPSGTNWGDVAVVGAARLADVLGCPVQPDSPVTFWKKFGLSAIRAPRQSKANVMIDDLVFELVTEGGSRIIWGRAPGSRHPGELTAEQKIGRLQEYLADFGSFDHPQGPCEIEIHHWQSITRRPLAATPHDPPR